LDDIFFSFPCLIALARTSRLNKIGKGKHHCFILDLREKAPGFPIQYQISCWLIINVLHYFKVYSFYT
jgi:hypothetical protein